MTSALVSAAFAVGGAASAATLPVTATATGCAASGGEGWACIAVDESLAESAALLFWLSLPPGSLVVSAAALFAGARLMALAAALKAAAIAALLGISLPSLAAESGVAATFPGGAALPFDEFAFAPFDALAALPSLVEAGADTVFAVLFAFAVPGPRPARFCDVAANLCVPTAAAFGTAVPAAPAPGVALAAEA